MYSFFTQHKHFFKLFTVGAIGVLLIVVLKNKEIVEDFKLFRVGTPSTETQISLPARELSTEKESALSFPLPTIKNDELLSYGDVVRLYGEKRIQFDGQCQAVPTRMVYKEGETIVLDNRSEELIGVKFIDDIYALPPYHVRIVTLNRQGIFTIDCGQRKNVAEIIVQ